MYQLEFAERMVAKPGDSNYSRLSLMLHYSADVEILFKIPPEAFYPQPKISSAVVKLSPNRKVELNDNLINVSRALFQHKRKKTRNALLDSFHEIADLNKIEAGKIVEKLDPDLINKRVLQLNPDEVLLLSRKLEYLLENEI
jgi:16S rRNA (adenine1518-N6/adenine1519-N6)-dimethyltransferase